MSEFLSAQQVADQLGVAEKTVRRWIERGRLTADRDGHAFRIRLEDAVAVYERTFAGRAAMRVSEAVSDRDRELESLKREVAELGGRYQEAKERLAVVEAERDEARRLLMRMELESELRSPRAA